MIEGKDFKKKVLDEDGNIKQQEFDEVWKPLRVMARCSPTDKLTIVKGTFLSWRSSWTNDLIDYFIQQLYISASLKSFLKTCSIDTVDLQIYLIHIFMHMCLVLGLGTHFRWYLSGALIAWPDKFSRISIQSLSKKHPFHVACVIWHEQIAKANLASKYVLTSSQII